MTLKGKQNHYNVKLLSGYGLSVKLKNNHLVLTDGYNPFSDEQQKEEWFITQLPYEKIVISGKGYLTTEAISLLSQHYKNIILTDTFGNPISFMNGGKQSFTATKYRIGQYDTFRNPEKCNYLCTQILVSKLASHVMVIESIPSDAKHETISILKQSINQIKNSQNLKQVEAKYAKVYFEFYKKLFSPKFCFESRNQSSKKTTKQDASDPINGLLNLGYTVLASQICKYIQAVGLDPYFGFYHKPDSGFQSLVYDLIEPFRWLVDYTVYHVANTKDSRKCIREKDYAWTKNGQIVLSHELKRKFLGKLERVFQKDRVYKIRQGRKMNNGLSTCQEITVAKTAVQNLADYCTGKLKDFTLY